MRLLLAATSLSALALPAWADTVVAAAPAPFVDLTGVAVAVTGGVFSVIGIVLSLWIPSHLKDQAAAAALSTAVKNSLGAMQQASTAAIRQLDPRLPLPASTPPDVAVGVQYVLDHAGEEAKRLGVTRDSVASKVNAQIGLANIATNQATAASDAPTPAPLDPVAVAPTVPVSMPVHIVPGPGAPVVQPGTAA